LTYTRQKLTYVNNPLNSLTPDFMVKSAWVSTALALILTVPPLGLFLGIFQTTGSLLVGVTIGFGLHFLLIALSGKISSALSTLFED
jgi:lipopolysaccharide export LptBFGC system permease protein LptF